jgi:hypothetical protein
MEVKKGQKWLKRNSEKQVRVRDYDGGIVTFVNLNQNAGKIEQIPHHEFIYKYRILTNV